MQLVRWLLCSSAHNGAAALKPPASTETPRAVMQVVMSRGGYTSAIDMWSLGCIFGELIQRVSRVGSANTPHLQVSRCCCGQHRAQGEASARSLAWVGDLRMTCYSA